ncbi:hypothetical protein BN6_31240 [Saccharothrix espanaensis DSM 44229]|uniref:Uncharacterized protein n=1 Tax=Saccharothrix espanaensis (strain ATCC 51144 / DSM 44229 / JCM 9112 / NBRC 15066 / NRRL 15764) TaxID=1179773 RepID=K0K0K9_SACES|nr:hypothetical protein BN6_31240 [Saccharothrix espanaensis DSM 44229]
MVRAGAGRARGGRAVPRHDLGGRVRHRAGCDHRRTGADRHRAELPQPPARGEDGDRVGGRALAADVGRRGGAQRAGLGRAARLGGDAARVRPAHRDVGDVRRAAPRLHRTGRRRPVPFPAGGTRRPGGLTGRGARVTLASVSCASATLVVWTSAWLHGAAAADDVLDALGFWAELHEVVADDDGTATALDLPGPDERPVGPALLLAALRRGNASTARMVLPIPGDVRGLGGQGPLSRFALSVGHAAVLPEVGVGLVPKLVADGVLRWTVFDLPTVTAVEHVPIGEAEHGLGSAMREAATALVTLDVARHRPNVRAEIAELSAEHSKLAWPAGMPPRALRVLQRAAEVAAILTVAASDAPGGAMSASAQAGRDQALRPLSEAVRRARLAAVDEAVRVLSDQGAGRH